MAIQIVRPLVRWVSVSRHLAFGVPAPLTLSRAFSQDEGGCGDATTHWTTSTGGDCVFEGGLRPYLVDTLNHTAEQYTGTVWNDRNDP